jgi:carboxyl-terminal processing protease
MTDDSSSASSRFRLTLGLALRRGMVMLPLLAGLCGGCQWIRPAALPAVAYTDTRRQLDLQSYDTVGDLVAQTYFYPARLEAGEGNVDWPAARQKHRPAVEQATSADAARAAMNRLLDQLEETHFAVFAGDEGGHSDTAPNGQSTVKPTTVSTNPSTTQPATQPLVASVDGAGDLGLTLRLMSGQAVVFRVEPGSAAADAGIGPGWWLTKVNGESVREFISDRAQALPATRLSGARILHALQARLAAPPGDTMNLELRDAANRRRTVKLTARTGTTPLARFGSLPPMPVRVETRTLDQGVGYFALGIFLDPGRVMARFDAFIREHESAPGLIIDLRGNGGGLGVMATGLCGYFVDKPNQRLGTMITRAGTLHFAINPRFPQFKGKVAVLVDGGSMSTSEILAGGLQDLQRARVFGEPTPGAALPSTVVTLPNGDKFQYAVADYTSAGGKRLEGRGVTPDEIVWLSRDALLQGRDPVVEAAMKWIVE